MSLEMIISLLTLVGSAVGWIYYAKENKKTKQLENDNATIKNISDTNNEWKLLYEETKARLDKYEIKYEELRMLVEELYKKIDEIYTALSKHRDEKISLREEVKKLSIELAEQKIKECTVRKCSNRQPPSDF